jgi:hypothetical protein
MDELCLLDGSYQDAVSALLEKYGPATDDFFSDKSYARFKNGEIKAPSKRKISRTNEGLFCHHIDEDKQILISTPQAILFYDIPFEYQKKDRLVYCNLIEHAVLHLLIAAETYDENSSGQLLGIGGYMNFIRPNILSWLVFGNEPTAKWSINCWKTIQMEPRKAKKMVKEMDKFLLRNYPSVTRRDLKDAYEESVFNTF